jgi:hypothetical protein
MSNPKYKLNDSILDTAGGIAKLERDGFTRDQIHRQMYQVTEGASTRERTEIMKKLYDRKKPC